MFHKFIFRLAFLCHNLLEEAADGFDFLMTIENGPQHLFFTEFIRTGFHHHNGVFRAGNG